MHITHRPALHVQASWKRVPSDENTTPLLMQQQQGSIKQQQQQVNGVSARQNAKTNMTNKGGAAQSLHEDDEEIQSSRASTPETLPEVPPVLGGDAEGDVREFEMTVKHPEIPTQLSLPHSLPFSLTHTHAHAQVNHSKILILISKYAQCALTTDDHESWIRQV